MLVRNVVPFDLTPTSPERIWMYLDRALTALLRRIQAQAPHWRGEKEHGQTSSERHRIVEVSVMELLGHLAVAELLAAANGWPDEARKIHAISEIVRSSNVRTHEVRERIYQLHHQYQRESVDRSRLASTA